MGHCNVDTSTRTRKAHQAQEQAPRNTKQTRGNCHWRPVARCRRQWRPVAASGGQWRQKQQRWVCGGSCIQWDVKCKQKHRHKGTHGAASAAMAELMRRTGGGRPCVRHRQQTEGQTPTQQVTPGSDAAVNSQNPGVCAAQRHNKPGLVWRPTEEAVGTDPAHCQWGVFGPHVSRPYFHACFRRLRLRERPSGRVRRVGNTALHRTVESGTVKLPEPGCARGAAATPGLMPRRAPDHACPPRRRPHRRLPLCAPPPTLHSLRPAPRRCPAPPPPAPARHGRAAAARTCGGFHCPFLPSFFPAFLPSCVCACE